MPKQDQELGAAAASDNAPVTVEPVTERQGGVPPEGAPSEPDPTMEPRDAEAEALKAAVDAAVAPIKPPENALGPDEIEPSIKLPMALVLDKKLMVRYAGNLGRNPQESQSRRQQLRLSHEIMTLYHAYKYYCENHGLDYWTERGFAAALICHQRGVPIHEPEEEEAQDVLDNLSRRI